MSARKGLTSSLRHKILVERPLRTSDGAGGFAIGWGAHCTLWAAISSGNGKERYAFGKLSASYSHIFRVRFAVELTEEMRIVHDGRVFNIRAIINRDDADEILDIYTEENVAS